MKLFQNCVILVQARIESDTPLSKENCCSFSKLKHCLVHNFVGFPICTSANDTELSQGNKIKQTTDKEHS